MSALLALLVLAASPAPVTSVTVFGDRARIVRTAVLTSDAAPVEFPLLHGGVDVSTIRVEAVGARVLRVDFENVPAAAFFGDAARKASDLVQQLSDRIAVATSARDARDQQIVELRRLAPVAPKDEFGRPPARLDATGWGTALQFVATRVAHLQGERQQLSQQLLKLEAEKAQATKDAERLGGGRVEAGVRVRATLRGEGTLRVLLSYETAAARWRPSYELQYLPERGRVVLAFSGLVSQESNEDWENVRLTLSTARPNRFARVPELLAWKIGQADRFVPTPTPTPPKMEPAPEAGAQPPSESNSAAEEKVRSSSALARPAPAPPGPAGSAQGELVGRVVDAATHAPVSDVVVTATSPQTPGETAAVTDANGSYALGLLPAGTYGLRFEKEGYKPYHRGSIAIDGKRRLRLNVDLLPESVSLTGQEVVVAGKASVIDIAQDRAVSQNIALQKQSRLEEGSGLAPPQAYEVATPGASELTAEAAGLDLAFVSAHTETVLSGKGTLRVPLTTETWPVEVTRKAFPALSPQTYLVARLKSPAKQVLPGGPVALSVGMDPAGLAQLPVMRPGEDITLPLGVDRALRPIRNVHLVAAEKGVFSKDDVSEYQVTLEMANPYRAPVAVTFVDQVPVASGDNIQVTLLEMKPWARQDKETGRLEWDLTLPPTGKVTASFRYRVVRPKGWKLEQRETVVKP